MDGRRLSGWGSTFVFLAVAALGMPVWGQVPPLLSPEPPRPDHRRLESAFEESRFRQSLSSLPAKASVDEIESALAELLPEVYRATNRDLNVVAELVAELRRQPGAVAGLVRQFRQLPAESIEQRLVVLGLLGEMKRPDALAPLREVVWEKLPPADSRAELLTERDVEEMVQVKAVHGLAFLGTPEADAVVRDVILHHEALHVRISAIDAYMWNRGDSPAAAAELYRSLPRDLHPYVERPRFHRGMDRREFVRRLHSWQERWGAQPEEKGTGIDHDGGVQ